MKFLIDFFKLWWFKEPSKKEGFIQFPGVHDVRGEEYILDDNGKIVQIYNVKKKA